MCSQYLHTEHLPSFASSNFSVDSYSKHVFTHLVTSDNTFSAVLRTCRNLGSSIVAGLYPRNSVVWATMWRIDI